MNGEKAKICRRIAEMQTVGQPKAQYRAAPGRKAHQHILVLMHGCTRHAYQRMKRGYLTALRTGVPLPIGNPMEQVKEARFAKLRKREAGL